MILTTGVRSGIGKYLHERLGGIGLHRANRASVLSELRASGVQTIIHCAASAGSTVASEKFPQFLDDNFFLTDELLALPHRKFIFFSTVDLYPKNNLLHPEDEKINVDAVEGAYALSKLVSETMIARSTPNFLILRPVSLVGTDARPNGPLRILRGQETELTLTADSEFNCVLHEDILRFIEMALEKDLQGIFNVASSETMTLRQVADFAGRKIRFGSYRYRVGKIDNRKIAGLHSVFRRGTRETLERFLKESVAV